MAISCWILQDTSFILVSSGLSQQLFNLFSFLSLFSLYTFYTFSFVVDKVVLEVEIYKVSMYKITQCVSTKPNFFRIQKISLGLNSSRFWLHVRKFTRWQSWIWTGHQVDSRDGDDHGRKSRSSTFPLVRRALHQGILGCQVMFHLLLSLHLFCCSLQVVLKVVIGLLLITIFVTCIIIFFFWVL